MSLTGTEAMDEPKLTNHQYKIKGNKLWTLTQEYYDELKETYPLHDVEGEMRKAKAWCKTINASRRKTAVGMQRFLNGWVSRSEATGHVTIDPEKTPSEMTYERNIKDKIRDWQSVIQEWSDEKLRASKAFQSAWKYPEFRNWVKEQRQGRKPDPVEVVADLPPPKTRKDRIIDRVREVKQAKADGRIEQIIRSNNLF